MKIRILIVALVAVLLLAGCKNKETPATTAPKTPTNATRPVYTLPQASFPESQARAIALEHAGYTEEQLSAFFLELDMEDSTPHYEIEFQVGRDEYEYKIHAHTGEILSYSHDIDD